MLKEDQDEYLALNVALMRGTGLWPSTTKDVLRSGLLVLWLGSFVALQLLKALQPEVLRDVRDLTEVGCFCLNSSLSLLKILHLLRSRGRLHALLGAVRRDCHVYGRLQPARALSGLLPRCERRLRQGTLWLIGLAACVSALFVLLPVLAPDLNLSLPVKMWFPLDTASGPGFVAAWCYVAGLFVVFTPVYVLLQTFYVGLVMLTCGQLKVLASLLAEPRSDLRFCQRMHNSVLKSATELQAILSPLLVAQFLVGTAIICQTGIQLTSGPISHVRTVKFASYLAVVLLDLWLFCYFGGQLEHHSSRLQEAAYSCPWYEMPVSRQKDLAIVMCRAQRPVTLTIGKMAPVSLATFTEVIKMSYSLFTLLSQVNERQE